MTMTDPIADMLTRVCATPTRRTTTACPCRSPSSSPTSPRSSRRRATSPGWTVEDAEVGKTLTIELKYGPNRERSIAGIRRVSKPGLRVYAKSTNLPRVLGGLGVAILSTSSGLLTDRQAAKKGVGGEVLAYVW